MIRLVLPVSAFAATVFVANRLMGDSELVVMQATGFSSFRLARPVLYFGLFVVVMMSLLTHVLVPASRTALTERSTEIQENITSRFLRDGQFLHPAEGVTLYIRHISENGELRDLFLSDDRSPGKTVTYTARRALLARGDTGPKLLMFDGMTQTLTHATTLRCWKKPMPALPSLSLRLRPHLSGLARCFWARSAALACGGRSSLPWFC